MYNTDFKVKYNDIKEELLKNKTEELQNQEYEYGTQDILDICSKLYRDELCSVFYAEDILDDKIDIGLKYVLEQMIINNHFKVIVDELKELLFSNNNMILEGEGEGQEKEKEKFIQNSNLMIMLTLFAEGTFYIFHKCICQQLTLGTIDSNLLDELKKTTIDIIDIVKWE